MSEDGLFSRVRRRIRFRTDIDVEAYHTAAL